MLTLFLTTSSYAFAETKSIINKKNEFGGKTVMTTYSQNDEGYRRGVSKEIVYFDEKEKNLKMELHHTENSIAKDGVLKSIMYLDGNWKIMITERHFNVEYILKTGIAKSIIYFDNKGKMIKGRPISEAKNQQGRMGFQRASYTLTAKKRPQ